MGIKYRVVNGYCYVSSIDIVHSDFFLLGTPSKMEFNDIICCSILANKVLCIYKLNFTSLKNRADEWLSLSVVGFVTFLYLLVPELGNKFLNYIYPSILCISIFVVLTFSKILIKVSF